MKSPRRRATRAEAEVGKEIAALKAELNDTRNYAAEIALGVTHYPHSDKEPCVRCERDSLRATVERVRALPNELRTDERVIGTEGRSIEYQRGHRAGRWDAASLIETSLAPVGGSGACLTCDGAKLVLRIYDRPGGPTGNGYVDCPSCTPPSVPTRDGGRPATPGGLPCDSAAGGPGKGGEETPVTTRPGATHDGSGGGIHGTSAATEAGPRTPVTCMDAAAATDPYTGPERRVARRVLRTTVTVDGGGWAAPWITLRIVERGPQRALHADTRKERK